MVASTPQDGGTLGFTVHRLRVTLLDVEPPVWRLLRVPSALPLSTVHAVLQLAFGWADGHLHEWRIGETTFGLAGEASWGELLEDESVAILGEVAPADTVLRYDYDLGGDGWETVVEVVGVDAYEGRESPVAALDGAGAAPPEDCGGPVGYEHLLDAHRDPDDVEHEDAVALLGEGYDAADPDLGRLNARLGELWRS